MEASSKSIRVLVADDHALLAEMVKAYLSKDDTFETATAATLDETLKTIKSEKYFDLVMLDLDMPGMQGISGVEAVVAANDGGHVVLFSGMARRETVFHAIEAGVRGYIPKTLSAKSLVAAINFVIAGEIYIPNAVTASFMDQGHSTGGLLTNKEISVLRCISRGETNKDIARELGVTEITVKMHVRSICAKLCVTNRTQIAVMALARGLV